MEEKHDDMLLDNARILTGLANQLEILESLLGVLNYSKMQGDTFTIQYQINSGVFEKVGDSITNVRRSIEEVSNEICPEVTL